MCRTLVPPTILICAITFDAVATIGFSMVTSGGGNNLSPNEYIYPEHITNICPTNILESGGEPSTWFPPGRHVEQLNVNT